MKQNSAGYLPSCIAYLLTVAMKSSKSRAQPIISLISCSNWNSQAKTYLRVLFLVTCKTWKPAVPGLCIHRLLHCSSVFSRNWYLVQALTLQVGSTLISFAFAAGMLVFDAAYRVRARFVPWIFWISYSIYNKRKI